MGGKNNKYNESNTIKLFVKLRCNEGTCIN